MKGLVIKCIKCGFANNITQHSVLIKHKVPYTCDGEKIYLTYFDCTECGKRHFVQIDDDNTNALYRGCYKYMVRLSEADRKRKPIKNKDRLNFKELRKKLNRDRFELIKKYNGREVIDENCESSVLIFTVTN